MRRPDCGPIPSLKRGIAVSALLLLSLTGCGDSGGEREIARTRTVKRESFRFFPGLSDAQRFGLSAEQGAGASSQPTLHYTLPEGWQDLPPAQFRDANFLVQDGRVDCYVSFAQGGLVANVNRWRDQMGLPEATAQEIAGLPKLPFMGSEATLVDLQGTFSSREGPKENHRMLGLILEAGNTGVFLKMVGPAELVALEEENLLQFLPTLHMDVGDQHGVTPGAAPMAGGPPAAEPVLRWETPAGWTEQPPTQFRNADFRAHDGKVECYVSFAQGGLVANVNRWRSQMGLAEAPTVEIQNLPKVPLLGQEASLVDLTGTYRGMDGSAQDDMRMLGLILDVGNTGVFVKLIGPAALVAEEEARFLALVASLRLEVPGGHGAAPPNGGAATGPPVSGPVDFVVPDGWNRLPDRPMRLATLTPAEAPESECVLTILNGNGGGIPMNINRWRDQVGQAPLSDGDIAALPTLEVLGVQATLVEMGGSYNDSLTGRSFPDAMLLGLLAEMPDQALFVKLTGPRDQVEQVRDEFLTLCRSLQLSEAH